MLNPISLVKIPTYTLRKRYRSEELDQISPDVHLVELRKEIFSYESDLPSEGTIDKKFKISETETVEWMILRPSEKGIRKTHLDIEFLKLSRLD